jgi:hypothetical protein
MGIINLHLVLRYVWPRCCIPVGGVQIHHNFYIITQSEYNNLNLLVKKAAYVVKMPGNEYISPNPSTGCRREFLSNPATIDLFKNRWRGWSGTLSPNEPGKCQTMYLRVSTAIPSKPTGSPGVISIRIHTLVLIFTLLMAAPVCGTTITLEPDQIESGETVSISIFDLPDGAVFTLDMQARLQVTPGATFSFETGNFVMPFTLEDGELAASLENTEQNILNAKKGDTEVKKIGRSVDGQYSTSEAGTISAGTYEFIRVGGIASPDATEVIATLSLSGTKSGPDDSVISFDAIGTSAGSVEISVHVDGQEALFQTLVIGEPAATTVPTTSPTVTYTYSGGGSSGGGGGGSYTGWVAATTTTKTPTLTTAAVPSPDTTITFQETSRPAVSDQTKGPVSESPAPSPPPTTAASGCLGAALAMVIGTIVFSLRKR